jgi:hypothetical protein
MPRAGSLTRLNCAEFRDDAWVEMDRFDGSTIDAASSRRPAPSPAGRGISRGVTQQSANGICHAAPHLHNPGENPKLNHARAFPIHDGGNRPGPFPGAGAA